MDRTVRHPHVASARMEAAEFSRKVGVGPDPASRAGKDLVPAIIEQRIDPVHGGGQRDRVDAAGAFQRAQVAGPRVVEVPLMIMSGLVVSLPNQEHVGRAVEDFPHVDA